MLIMFFRVGAHNFVSGELALILLISTCQTKTIMIKTRLNVLVGNLQEIP